MNVYVRLMDGLVSCGWDGLSWVGWSCL